MKHTLYALLEEGKVHTEDLTLERANEMLERHKRIFPEINWDIASVEEIRNVERLEGFLERHRRIAMLYRS